MSPCWFGGVCWYEQCDTGRCVRLEIAECDRQFRDWCRDRGLDPEDVGSTLKYEDYYTECVLPNL